MHTYIGKCYPTLTMSSIYQTPEIVSDDCTRLQNTLLYLSPATCFGHDLTLKRYKVGQFIVKYIIEWNPSKIHIEAHLIEYNRIIITFCCIILQPYQTPIQIFFLSSPSPFSILLFDEIILVYGYTPTICARNSFVYI